MDIWNESEIQLAFKSQYIDSIVTRGFLNLHQTGHSNSVTAYEKRIMVENLISGIQLPAGEPSDTIRPKYAFLGFSKQVEGFFPQYAPYGDIIAVFRSERVKQRTTYTPFDSFGVIRNGDARTLRDRPGRRDQLRAGAYIEAQIWGPLMVSDVNYFLVNCFTDRGEYPRVTQEAIRKLVRTNIPVFECNRKRAAEHGWNALLPGHRY